MKGIIIIITLLSSHLVLAQSDSSQLSEPTQYRRGTELQAGYQTYEQKYQGKDLNEEKRRLFPLESTGVWTELNPKVPRVDYLGIHFVNTDKGWACGDLGALIKTTDGGDNWTISGVQSTALLLKVYSYNGQVVIVTGYDGMILRSTDGGENFVQITSGVGTGIDLWGVQMLNDTLGWVCGMNHTLLKTTDAGESWQMVAPGLNQHYWSLDFLNEQYGMIACGGGKVLKTTDGGNNWSEIQAGDTRALYTIDIIDSLHIAAGGASTGMGSKNIYSSDGGMNWTENGNLIYENGVNCISFINTDTGYVVGENWAIRKTTNRGQSWFASDPMYTEWWLDLLAGGEGYAVGNSLKIYKTTGGYDNWEKLFLTDNLNDVFFIDDFTGFVVVSDPSRLYKTENGGINWDSIPGAPGGNDLLFLDSLTGFVGGYTIYKTTNGGVSWYPTNGITNSIRKIFFINSQTGWAAGGQRVFKTTDGGENWIEQINGGTDTFTSIYFVDSLNGWATSRYIWQTTNGGASWSQNTNIPFTFSTDIYFRNLDTGWTVRYSSVFPSLYKTTNGGLAWNDIPNVQGANKIFLFPDPIHWLISAIYFSVPKTYFTTDGGDTWIDITPDIPSGFNSFCSISNHIGYAAGNQGLILKYQDTTYIPVNLFTFSATANNKNVMLNWSTATETNNKGFEVQRSVRKDSYREVRDQRLVWKDIGFVEGNGTSTLPHSYSHKDNNVEPGNYYYRLKQIDFDGSFNYNKEIGVSVIVPTKFTLEQNFPNPFNPETNISFTIPFETHVTLSLYDITGREIKVLVNEEKQPGYYTVKLKGGELSSTVYFFRLESSSGYSATKKLILLK